MPARHLSRILATAPSSGLARRGPTACAALLVRDSVEKPSAAAARATLPSFAARRLSKCQSARSRAQRAHPVVRPLAEARSRSAASEGRQRGLRRPGRGTACAAPPTQRGAERHPPCRSTPTDHWPVRGSASGSAMVNVLPWPSMLSAWIDPPCCDTISWVDGSPMPLPAIRPATLLPRWNHSKMWGRSSGGMPRACYELFEVPPISEAADRSRKSARNRPSGAYFRDARDARSS